MKTITSLLLTLLWIGTVFTSNVMADASKGQRFYLKKLKSSCKKSGVKSGDIFALQHNRYTWKSFKNTNKLQDEWIKICPKAKKKISKMRKKDIKNLYDFVWKYASDGERPSCG